MRLLRLGALMLFAARLAATHQFPEKPIGMIVPYAPGGGSDIVARIVGQRMIEAIGQTIVIDNRPGAAAMLGTELAAHAPADGYTLLLVDTSFTINQSYYRKPSYNTKQFVPVALIADTPYVLIAHPSLPANNVKDFIALAKAQPGKINLGSAGDGSGSHMTGELFQIEAGREPKHIPYKRSRAATGA